jgi:hypothetical protein
MVPNQTIKVNDGREVKFEFLDGSDAKLALNATLSLLSPPQPVHDIISPFIIVCLLIFPDFQGLTSIFFTFENAP